MLLLGITLALFGVSFGCQPVKIHYQTTYCRSSVAAIIKIDKATPSESVWVAYYYYEGTIVESLKGIDLPKGTNITVVTDGNLNSCGPVMVNVGSTYMLLGEAKKPNQIKVALFNGAKDVTEKETEKKIKKRIQSFGDCSCTDVQSYFYRWGPPLSPGDLPPLPPNKCRATSAFGCQWDNGACVRNPDGKCTYVTDCPAEPKPLQ